tara:strand:+ start:2726 stop:3091 length:366 start_codon:yes stop_codon:yes gene_type:complete
MSAMLKIVYPGLPPKEFSPNSRCHWSTRSKVGLKVQADVTLLIMEQGWVPKNVLERAVVRFKYGLPDKRRRDLDNLIGASKPMLDALVGVVIQDDRVGAITLEHSWFNSPRKPETIIEVEA